MNYQERLAISNAWWTHRVFGINRALFLVFVLSVIAAYSLPYILSLFIPCALYMEIETLMVVFFGLSALGALNMIFAFSPNAESILPVSLGRYYRIIVIWLFPVLLFAGIFWVAFGSFIPHLLGNADVLCD